MAICASSSLLSRYGVLRPTLQQQQQQQQQQHLLPHSKSRKYTYSNTLTAVENMLEAVVAGL